MPTHSNIVVQDEADGPLRILQEHLSDPGPHQILVKMIASGICQSQIFWMQQPRQAPMLFGHEGYGIAAAVGADVTGIKEGDHFLVTWLPRLDPGGRTPEKGTAPLDGTRPAVSPNVYTWADYAVANDLYVRALPPAECRRPESAPRCRNAAEMAAIGEDLVLLRQVRSSGVDQVEARQPVLPCDLLGSHPQSVCRVVAWNETPIPEESMACDCR